MVNSQLVSIAEEYFAARAETYDRFVAQLDAAGIGYFNREDVDHIAEGILNQTFDVLYHTCGQSIVLDGEQFRIHGGDWAGHVIEKCPRCEKPLDAYDLYTEPGSEVRNMLREAGLYPARDGLALIADAEQRQAILQDLGEMLAQLSDSDLLALYAVITDLLE
jgi:hypothetical protein